MIKLYIGAHIDDVLLGCFSRLNMANQTVYMLNTTDNMPDSLYYSKAYFEVSEANYKSRLEFEKSALIKRFSVKKFYELEIKDGTSFFHIDKIQKKILSIISELNPTEIYFPTYEGGHIDHEIVSVIIAKISKNMPKIKYFEYALYHKIQDRYVHNTFTHGSKERYNLSKTECQEKKQALKILSTKMVDIKYFLNDSHESIRPFIGVKIKDRQSEKLIYEKMNGISFNSFLKSLEDFGIIE